MPIEESLPRYFACPRLGRRLRSKPQRRSGCPGLLFENMCHAPECVKPQNLRVDPLHEQADYFVSWDLRVEGRLGCRAEDGWLCRRGDQAANAGEVSCRSGSGMSRGGLSSNTSRTKGVLLADPLGEPPLPAGWPEADAVFERERVEDDLARRLRVRGGRRPTRGNRLGGEGELVQGEPAIEDSVPGCPFGVRRPRQAPSEDSASRSP